MSEVKPVIQEQEPDKLEVLKAQSMARLALIYGNQLRFDFNGTQS